MRTCGYCSHDEIKHWGFECFAVTGSNQCGCLGFTARVITNKALKEYYTQAEERLKPRGQIGDLEVLDEYSAIREHLAEVMEKESRR